MLSEPLRPLARGVRAPRAAGVAGLLFSALFLTSIVLLHDQPPTGASAAEIKEFYSQGDGRYLDLVGLYVAPFAGIAFLWFIGVVRDRIGQQEDRFFATVFLGSGLLFVAMLFAGAAFAAGLGSLATASPSASNPGTLVVGHDITVLLLRVYGMRMAAVFTMSAATITLRTKVIPSWIGFTGIAVAIVLLVSIGLTPWVALLFPAWILLLSVEILRTGLRRPPAAAETAADAA